MLPVISSIVSMTFSRVASMFISQKMSKKPPKDSPQEKEKVAAMQREERKYREAQARREDELAQIQADLAKYKEIEVKAGMEIAMAQDEREERKIEISTQTLELKKQELALTKARLEYDIHLAESQRQQIEQSLLLRERQVQIMEQDLHERHNISLLHIDVLREQGAQALASNLHTIQGNWDQENWPGVLSRLEIEAMLRDWQQSPRLLVLAAPPEISKQCPKDFRAELEQELRGELKSFFTKYFPKQSELYPVEFYGKFFKRPIFDVEVKQLQGLLHSLPTVVMYSEILKDRVKLHVDGWAVEGVMPFDLEWNWAQEQQLLIESGMTEEKSLSAVREQIVKLHELIAAFLSDVHYLNVNPFHEPCLLQLQDEFPSEYYAACIEHLKIIQHRRIEEHNQELKMLTTETTLESHVLDEDNNLPEHSVETAEYSIQIIVTDAFLHSGTRTMVNLLCGHEIMPVGCEKTSEGFVTIHHHPHKRTLRILHTDGANWKCGEWENLSDDGIQTRLKETMECYHNAKKAAAEDLKLQEPKCPLFELEFPTQIGLSKDFLRLPGVFQLKIMLLPPYRFFDSDVIRQCRKGVCLVMYDSGNLDPKLKEIKLQGVVTQVKNLGGSPARMLFVLNRIDGFRNDIDWEKQEREFVEETSQNIKRELLKALPEYEEDIQHVKVVKLSSLAAFLALTMKSGDNNRQQISADKLNKWFQSLIPEEIRDDLPIAIKKWTTKDMYQVADAVWKTSYAQDFYEILQQHLQTYKIKRMTLQQIIQTKKDQAQRFMTQWVAVRDQMGVVFGAEREEIATALQALDSANSAAHNHLIDRLDHPTICIATTGTTSSGKSTVVNLLCGHEIMPVSLMEMSAGVVTIYHHPRKRTLRILETDGALWKCGEWENLTDEEIQSRLKETMDIYNDARKKASEEKSSVKEPDCPLVELEFPTRIGLTNDYLHLPGTFQLKIMDLPGYKFVGDEGNLNVIKNCKEALCLVMYNSGNPDPKLKETLLQEVITQVKNLGGSPARMLFVLNRIDEFRNDIDWQKQEREFVEETSRNIKKELLKALPEYEHDIQHVKIVKLSSLPAFLALHMKDGNRNQQLQAADRINNRFASIIPTAIRDDLPRRAEKWSSQDMIRVSDGIHETSYAKDFQASLKQHIEDHLPEIIIPQIIDEFKQNIAAENAQRQNCAVWTLQTLDAAIRMSRDGYQSTLNWLKTVEKQLEQQRQVRAEKLLKPFARIAEIMKNPSASHDVDKELQAMYKEGIYSREDLATLNPLITWRDALADTAMRFLEEICIVLDRGEPLKGILFESLPKTERRDLRNTYDKLLEYGYARKKGTRFETRDEQETVELKRLNKALNDLSEDMADAMAQITRRAVEQEKGRIYEAIKTIADNQLRET